MKLFLDPEGNVIGSYESESPEVENIASMEGASTLQVHEGLEDHPHQYKFVNGELYHRDQLKADRESQKPERKKKRS